MQTTTLPSAQSGVEPVRHKVERGETAYTIARLYDVSVRSLADWNGLGSDLSVREGQYLLIPVALPDSGDNRQAAAATTQPGAGSPTPEPPSASRPLPENDNRPRRRAGKKQRPGPWRHADRRQQRRCDDLPGARRHHPRLRQGPE